MSVDRVTERIARCLLIVDTTGPNQEHATVPSEHLLIEVSWHDGHKALIDVLVVEDLGDEIKPASVGETVYSIDPDVLENDDDFRVFVREITGHVSDGDVVRAATLDLWRGALLDRLGVKGGDPPTPIPYDAEGA